MDISAVSDTNMYIFAQIQDNKVIGVSQLSGPVEDPNMILITEDQYATVLGWIYDPTTNEFTEPPALTEPPPYMTFEQAMSIRALSDYGIDIPIQQLGLVQSALVAASGFELPELQGEAPWRPGEYVRGHVIRTFERVSYRLIQAHITQVGWEPPNVPALWAVSQSEWDAWVQPTGAHDAYMQGDRVTHNGQRWISDINGNVWPPGVHGWSETV